VKLVRINLVLLLITVFLMLSSSAVYASEWDEKQRIDAVKSSIQKSFEYYKNPLDANKTVYGLTGSESFTSATLGDGVPYYIVSSDDPVPKQIAKDDFSFDGYIFPIKIGNKSAGVLFAKKLNGNWSISKVTSYATFEQDIAGAKQLLQSTPSPMLVFDEKLGIAALITRDISGNKIVPVWDINHYNLKKNQIESYGQNSQTFRQFLATRTTTQKSDPEIVKGANLSTATSDPGLKLRDHYYIGIDLVFIVLTVGILAIKGRRTLSE
jgi:hypothetical protein